MHLHFPILLYIAIKAHYLVFVDIAGLVAVLYSANNFELSDASLLSLCDCFELLFLLLIYLVRFEGVVARSASGFFEISILGSRQTSLGSWHRI